jgi:hypothetical protein
MTMIMLCKTLVGCLSTMSSAQLTACLRDLARHFKIDPTDMAHNVFKTV